MKDKDWRDTLASLARELKRTLGDDGICYLSMDNRGKKTIVVVISEDDSARKVFDVDSTQFKIHYIDENGYFEIAFSNPSRAEFFMKVYEKGGVK